MCIIELFSVLLQAMLVQTSKGILVRNSVSNSLIAKFVVSQIALFCAAPLPCPLLSVRHSFLVPYVLHLAHAVAPDDAKCY